MLDQFYTLLVEMVLWSGPQKKMDWLRSYSKSEADLEQIPVLATM